MKWSMDTHKYISEITRKALQIMVSHNITSESEAEEIDAVERELGASGVYKDYEGAKGRVRRALFTYFKAYGCLDDSERLTEIGRLYAESKISIREFSFYYILNYVYEENDAKYYPAHLILKFFKLIREIAPAQEYMTAYDFSRIVECNNVDEVSADFVRELIESRDGEPVTVNERSIGYDVWAKMLIQELVKMIEEMGIPFAYDHFAEGESPDPPFICYLLPDDENFAADGKVYYRISGVRIELYTDFKDPILEQKVTAVLDSHGIFYARNEVWIEDEKLYEVAFEFAMPV